MSGAGTGGIAHVAAGGALRGSVRVPGDKSISHRALLLSALAEGPSVLTGLSTGDDVRRTLDAIRRLGIDVDTDHGVTTVHGGRARLHRPDGSLDLGNSGTGMRLLLGLLATMAFEVVLTGDASLRTRPMDRVADPLERMGARVTGSGPRRNPPVTVSGGQLRSIEYTPPMASAQVKSAVLLAGLDASGETVVHEPVRTRAHTEEMLEAMGADLAVTVDSRGRTVRIRRSALRPTAVAVPGDPSQAAFWLVAAALVDGSAVTADGLTLADERTGYLAVLRRMGADIEIDEDAGGQGSVTVRTSTLRATTVRAEEIPSLDEVPILAVAAARAEGETRFCDVAELRLKESDRLTGTATLVTVLGGEARIDGDDLVVVGVPALRGGGTVDAAGDHRIAMAAAVGAAAARRGTVTVSGWDTVATSYPGFLEELDRLRGAG